MSTGPKCISAPSLPNGPRTVVSLLARVLGEDWTTCRRLTQARLESDGVAFLPTFTLQPPQKEIHRTGDPWQNHAADSYAKLQSGQQLSREHSRILRVRQRCKQDNGQKLRFTRLAEEFKFPSFATFREERANKGSAMPAIA